MLAPGGARDYVWGMNVPEMLLQFALIAGAVMVGGCGAAGLILLSRRSFEEAESAQRLFLFGLLLISTALFLGVLTAYLTT